MNVSAIEAVMRDVYSPRVMTKCGLPHDTRLELLLVPESDVAPFLMLLLPPREQTPQIAAGVRKLDLTDYAYGGERFIAQLDRQIWDTARHLAADRRQR